MSTPQRITSRVLYPAVFIVVITLVLIPAGATLAKTTTWTNAASADSSWSTAGNWDNGVPVSSDRVYFSAIGGTSVMNISGLTLDELDMTGFTGTLDMQYGLDCSGDVLTAGVVDMVGRSLNIAGDFAVGGELQANSSRITLGGAMVVDGLLYASGSTLVIPYYLSGEPGAVLDLTASAIYVSIGVEVPDAEVTWTHSTLTLSGPENKYIALGPNSNVLAYVTISDWASINLASANDTLTVEGTWLMGRGILNIDAVIVTFDQFVIGYDATVEWGETNGVIDFQSVVDISGTFRGGGDNATLKFQPGMPFDITSGTFEFGGSAGKLGRLEQDGTVGGGQWILQHDATSTITIDYAKVQDCDAQGPGLIVATNSEDMGNNDGWDFGGTTKRVWTGTGGTNNWSDHTNWDRGAPGDNDVVEFDPSATGTSIQDIPGLTLTELSMGSYAGTLVIQSSLSTLQDMWTSGTVDATGTTIVVAGDLEVEGSMDASNGSLVDVGGSIIVNGGSLDVSGSTTTVAGNLNVAGEFECGSWGVVQVEGDMDCGAGTTINLGSGQMWLQSNGDFSDCASFTTTTGSLFLESPYSRYISFAPSGVTLNDVYVFGIGPSVVTSLACPGDTLTIGGNLSVDNGVLEIYDNLTVSGAVDIGPNGGIEGQSPGSVVDLEGTLTVSGVFSYKKSKVKLRLKSGSAVVVVGAATFEMAGDPAGRCVLEQDGIPGGTPWILSYDATATISVTYADVQDSDAQGPMPVQATNSFSFGNNTNWVFAPVGIGDDKPIPKELAVRAAPNPFNPSTTIHYELPHAGSVTLRIYDASGRRVRTLFAGDRPAGRYQVLWQGRNEAGSRVGSGIYFCRVENNSNAVVHKLVLLK